METGQNKTWDLMCIRIRGLPSILETSLKSNSNTEDKISTETGARSVNGSCDTETLTS